MARGVFVQGVSVQGNLCPGESLSGGLCPGGALSGRPPRETPPPRTVTSGWYASYCILVLLGGGGVRGMVQTSIINYENIVCFPVSSNKRMNIMIVGGCITSRNSTSWPCNLMAGKRIQTKDMRRVSRWIFSRYFCSIECFNLTLFHFCVSL